MDYLTIALQKYHSNNNLPDILWGASINEFVSGNFFHCDPNSRGAKFAHKLIMDNNGKVVKVSSKVKRGDVKIGSTYNEIKNPYLCRASNSYRITNIRPWQDFSNFIIGLVDCDDDFTPHFYVVRKDDLLNHPSIKLSNQNGDEETNKDNKKSNKVIALSKGKMYQTLSSINLLRGDTYDDLLDYVTYVSGKQPEPVSRWSHMESELH